MNKRYVTTLINEAILLMDKSKHSLYWDNNLSRVEKILEELREEIKS